MMAYTLCLGMGMNWQHAVTIVFISGILFVLLMITPLRKKLMTALPMQIRAAISTGIGLFICLIALFNAGIITANNNLLSLNSLLDGSPLLFIIGLLITSLLLIFKVPGAIFIGIIISTIIGIPLHVTFIPHNLFGEPITISPLFMKLQFNGLFTYGLFPVIGAIISFFLVDVWDTIGTLTAASSLASDLYDKDGVLINNDKALLADGIATVTGSLFFSQSTTTTFVESVNGIAAGGRTGLTSIIVGILFILATIFTPIFEIVPSAACAPALVIVAIMLMNNVTKINWNDLENAIPCFLTIAFMPFTYSISNGIGVGIISYTLIKIIRHKYKEIHPLMYILSALFILMFII